MKEKDLIKQVTDLNMPDFEKVRRNITHSKKDNFKSFTARKFAYVFVSCLVILSALMIPNLVDQQENKITNEVENLAEDLKDDLPSKEMIENHLVFNMNYFRVSRCYLLHANS